MDPEESSLKQIRTYQGDVAEALKKQQESLVSIQRAEQVKNPPRRPASPEAKRRRQYFFFSLASVMLFALGAAGIWYAYNEFLNRQVSPISAVPANRFISANSVVEIEVVPASSRESFINSLASAAPAGSQGELTHIILKKPASGSDALVTTEEFLQILGSRASGSLVRSFENNFMLGSLGQSRFIIFRLASYENAFGGMLAWERYMSADIGPLFATAPLLRDIEPNAAFTDLTDRNKDMRVLKTPEGQDVIFYSFFENSALVVTDNLESMRTLIDRLTRERLSR